MIVFLEIVLRFQNAQILPLNSWKGFSGFQKSYFWRIHCLTNLLRFAECSSPTNRCSVECALSQWYLSWSVFQTFKHQASFNVQSILFTVNDSTSNGNTRLCIFLIHMGNLFEIIYITTWMGINLIGKKWYLFVIVTMYMSI